MNNVESQISRMKSMMTYGLQTENKNNYSTVEYQREGADGKIYGIVREGTKYYVKVANTKNNPLKENFEYIGGFRNRKNNEYSSYANALKHFDMDMASLRESTGNKSVIIESWNPDKKEDLAVEATEKMRKEIARQRQIMGNAAAINEGKSVCCDDGDCGVGVKTVKDAEVLPKGKCGNIFCVDPTQPEGTEGAKPKETQKNNIGKAQAPKKGKAVKEAAEKLAWHQTGGDANSTMADTYMDTTHGTEIGSGAPFDKCPKGETNCEAENGVVEEGEVMHTSQNQDSPKPGVSDRGDDAPFDKKVVKEAFENDEEPMGKELEDTENPIEDEPIEDEPIDDTDDLDVDLDSEEDVDFDTEDDLADDDTESRLTSIEDMLQKVMDKLGVDQFEEDDTLYDDDDAEDFDDADDEFEIDIESDDDDFDFEEDDEDFDLEDDEDEDIDDDTEVFESKSYRRMKSLNEDRLDMFGKHPAYQKKVMTLPKNGEDKNEHGEDWNDESVHGEEPFGKKIGSGAPFEVSPEAIENAIAESIKKILKK